MDEKGFFPQSIRKRAALLIAILAALTYVLITRVIFGSDFNVYGPFSLSFFFLAPPILGFLTIILLPPEKEVSIPNAMLLPLAPMLACIFIAGIFHVEAWFCVILALPIFVGLASFGGIIARFIRKLDSGPRFGALLFAVSLPYLVTPIESLFPVQESIRRVHSQIDINASASVVWANITNFDPILPSEQSFAFFHLIGLPRPKRAQMHCAQVGCIRQGHWENGLVFDGTITEIELGKSYWVDLRADTRNVRSSMAPLAQIGGSQFGMVDDGYFIEDLGEGGSILHLYSTYRISTGINAYAGLWLDFLMRDIQRYILGIEKVRSESQAAFN